MSAPPQLPAAFADLEPYAAAWALPTRDARYHHRVACTMDEVRAFYDAVRARADEVVAYLDRVPLDALPDSDRPLLHLMLAWMDASRAVEVMGAPDVHWGFDAARLRIGDVAPL
jgi:hypothetical protein